MRSTCLLVTIIGLTLFGTSCDEDDPVFPSDPPTFGIFTLTQVEDSLFAEDTFLISTSSIFFRVDGQGRYYDSVAWQIGNDPRRFTEEQVSLAFNEEDTGDIDIELTIWPTPSEFFSEDTVLRFQKTIHVMSGNSAYAFEGTFRGSNVSDPTREFDVTVINFERRSPYEQQEWLHLFNFTEGCGGEEIDQDVFLPSIRWASYHHFYVEDIATSLGCQEIKGYGRLDTTTQDTLTIDYQYRIQGTNDYRDDQFVGIRIPQ